LYLLFTRVGLIEPVVFFCPDQLHRAPATRVRSALPGLMLRQSAFKVEGAPNVVGII
jgi:hypothetical protein